VSRVTLTDTPRPIAAPKKNWYYVNLSARLADPKRATASKPKPIRSIRAWFESTSPEGAVRQARKQLREGAWMPGYAFDHVLSVEKQAR
jgi:hypothetical protein